MACHDTINPMINHKLFNDRGFTLVELLVMLLVLGIIISIVTIGYVGYRENVYKTQIYNTVDTYKKAIKAYSLEHKSYPKLSTCLPHNSTCCTSNYDNPSTVYCGTNTEAGAIHNIDITGKTGSDISKYIPNQTPKLPVFTQFVDCVSGFTSNGPCKPSATIPDIGVFYISNVNGSKYTSTEPSLKDKGFLIYYVSTIYSCSSDKLMKLSGANLVFDNSAIYTRQTSTYRECIVGLDNL